MKDKPFRITHMFSDRKSYLYELYKLEALFAQLKEHLEKGGLPKVEVTLLLNKEGLRGKSFDVVIVDEEREGGEG